MVDLGKRSPARPRPLIERRQERTILERHLDMTLAGHGSLALVSGEAGIGKTTLVEHLGARAAESNGLVLWGHAYDLSITPPYGPWVDILWQARELGEGWPEVPAFLDDTDAMARVGSQDALFATTRDFFHQLATHRPLILVLDDLQWADQASLDFLRYVARQIVDYPILIVATYRTDELHRDHPLYTYLPLLVRETGATRVVIQPLSAADHRLLIRRQYQLGTKDQQRLEQYLIAHAEGNPLYAVELLRTLEQDGVLVQRKDRWSLDDMDQVRVPPLLLQVIEGRLRRLDDPTRRLLQVAAIIGQEVPIDLWQQVSGADDEALMRAVEHRIAAQLLVEGPGGSIRFHHALFREALYEGTGTVRRSLLHRQIAEHSEKSTNPDPDRIAYHYELAADERAIEWWIRAAARARSAYAWRAAAERLEGAARCQEHLGVRVVPQEMLLFESSIAIRYADPESALNRLNSAIAEAAQADGRAVAALARAERGYVRLFLGQIRDGPDEIERAVRLCDQIEAEEPGVFDRIDAQLSSFGPLGKWGLRFTVAARRSIVVLYWAMVGRLAEVLDASESLRDALLQADDAALSSGTIDTSPDAPFDAAYHVGNTALGLATLYTTLGRVDDAERFFDLAYRGFQTDGNPFEVGLSKWNELVALALPLQTEQIEQRRRLQQLVRGAWSRTHDMGPASLSQVEPEFAVPLIEGDWDKAREFGLICRDSHSYVWLRDAARAVLATIENHQGNTEAAIALVRETFPNGPATEPGNSEFISCQVLQRIAAHAALDQGNLNAARAWLEAHDRWLEWSGAVLGLADGDLAWAHYFNRAGDQAAAREHAEQALSSAINPRQALVLIAIHRFLGELDTHEHRFAGAAEHIQQSLMLAEACLAPFERALSLLALAGLRAAQQRADDARELLVQVRSICKSLKAIPTLERATALEAALNDTPPAQADSYPAGLTAREVQVLQLIAEGLTDAEAAERLFVSRRTVSQHLRHIYNKLGVSSRAAATRFAVEQHLF